MFSMKHIAVACKEEFIDYKGNKVRCEISSVHIIVWLMSKEHPHNLYSL